jgi:hypothetical protein
MREPNVFTSFTERLMGPYALIFGVVPHGIGQTQDRPNETSLPGSPAAFQAVYSSLVAPRIYVFVAGEDGHLYENYWDGSQWRWTSHRAPPNTLVASSPSAIAYWREPLGELSEIFQRSFRESMYSAWVATGLYFRSIGTGLNGRGCHTLHRAPRFRAATMYRSPSTPSTI